MIANIVFWGWPVFGFILFQRLPIVQASLWTVIGGYLILPLHMSLDLPALPAIDRDMIAVGAAMACAVITSAQYRAKFGTTEISQHRSLPGWVPQFKVIKILLIILILSSILTVLSNRDTVASGGRILIGMGIYDVFSWILTALVTMMPFVLARKFLSYEEGQRALLFVLCFAGLIYSLPTLYEVRMSPQLHKIIYGGNVVAWKQNLRSGGFRPAVFLGHGLTLGIFMAIAVLATAGCVRTLSAARKPIFVVAFLWLFVTLVLIKAFGALLIVILLAPVVFLCGARFQMLIAGSIAIIIMSYPILRGTDLVPTDMLVRNAAKIDLQRAASLEFRFDNEDELLEKASQRPAFGWGGWGRSRVYDERGRDVGTTDGQWAIILGLGGWVRYLTVFGLLSVSVLILAFKKKDYEVSIATSSQCLVLVANLIDLIPNAGLSIVTWTIAGALAGRLEVGAQTTEVPVKAESLTTDRHYPYARRPPRQFQARGSTVQKEM